jgi:hypothetical protein
MNAVRHGAYSEALTMLLEDPGAFAELRSGLMNTLHPVGPLEVGLVNRMASHFWRAERAKVAGNQALWMAAKQETLSSSPFLVGTGWMGECMALEADECRMASAWNHDIQARLLHHELTLERSFLRLLHELERIQARRQGQSVPPPVAVDVIISGDCEGG